MKIFPNFVISSNRVKIFLCSAGICNGDPDVDAIFRLINKKNFIFKKKFKIFN